MDIDCTDFEVGLLGLLHSPHKRGRSVSSAPLRRHGLVEAATGAEAARGFSLGRSSE